MTRTLDSLADQVRQLLQSAPIAGCAGDICTLMRDYLTDSAFVAQHLPERGSGEHPREVLYEDPDLGFCICGHVYPDAAESGPHDHGSSWAIYGQAEGTTEMTDWSISQEGTGDQPSLVVPEKIYTLSPGDAYFYDVGAVHSPKREGPTRLIRIEGANLDNVQRSAIAAA